MRIGYLECFSGISGDMLLGALVGAGVPAATLIEATEALGVGARLEVTTVLRGGLTGIKANVLVGNELADSAKHTHAHEQKHSHGRSLSSIRKTIENATLSEQAKQMALKAFQRLGEVEAAIHGVAIEKVHFHEIGAVDTIVDIVAAAVGCEWLKIDVWQCSPLNVGSGTLECAHGTLPVPAPATLALLQGAPIYSAGEPMERVTPTGAAMLYALGVTYGSTPAMKILSSGYGAGGRDLPGIPNLLRLTVGEQETRSGEAEEPITVIETVIDDSSPQLLAHVCELLLDAGAWDVYRTPVQMKKGRTGMELTVLCAPHLEAKMKSILFRETTTIGLRSREERKTILAREFASVKTQWGTVAIKIARLGDGTIANASPEFEDCRKLAIEAAVPLKLVMQDAMLAFHAQRDR